ncbi:MAG TPA: orotidine 5'-phosphate decarboxylase, partial [Marmoricola sp.]|nr:orotidine 5'-phosphate decarboxylase [Marmoricola sp.]
MITFGARVHALMQSRGPLCVGIDPHPGLLEQWGLPDDITGLESFSLTAA